MRRIHSRGRSIAAAVAVLAVLAACVTGGVGETQTAGAGGFEPDDWVVVDGDAVVPARALGRSGPQARADEGFALLVSADDHHNGGYVLRLGGGSSSGQARAHAEVAAAELEEITGGEYSVPAGTVTRAEPVSGEILVLVSAASPCGEGGWIGCGGPEGAVPEDDWTSWRWTSGRVWLHPDLFNFSSDVQLEVLLHEIGHAMGLGHYDAEYEGHLQVMHSNALTGPEYRSGDRNGLRFLSPLDDPPPTDPPPNDDFPGTTVTVVQGSSWSGEGHTGRATLEPGEPAHPNGAGATVWWTWTASAHGSVAIDTLGSGFDTVLAVYTGGSLGSLQLVASNDDATPLVRHSAVRLRVEPGRTYRIALGGWSSETGPYRILLTHDRCDPSWFTDVGLGHAFCGAITWLAATGTGSGYADGTFKPTAPVSRQAMAAFLHRASGAPTGPFPSPGFSDVPANHEFRHQIAWLANSGIASGYADGRFLPSAPVTRQAMAAFLHRASGAPTGPVPDPRFTDVPADHPFHDEIAWLAASGITTGFADGSFQPSAPVSRQAMAAFLERADL